MYEGIKGQENRCGIRKKWKKYRETMGKVLDEIKNNVGNDCESLDRNVIDVVTTA